MKLIAPKSAPLLDVLGELFPESSKRNLRIWIRAGRITKDDRPIRDSHFKVKADEELVFENKVKKAEKGIKILYEDRDLIVVQKPAGVLSVATVFEDCDTIHDILKRRYFKQRVYPVHRLDRETSGVMVFAYSERARDWLKEQFRLHTVEREYLALVQGKMEEKQGTWKSQLREDANYFVSSHPNEGKRAVTHYKVFRRTPSYTSLKLTLETGRKNQIRVHASEAGFPVVGDQKYGATESPLNRLGLHAHALAFLHPVSKKRLAFKAPLPTPLKKYFRGLK